MANPFHRLPTHPLFHLALFLLTLATTTFFGGFGLFSDRPLAQALSDASVWRSGLGFSLSLLLILGIHELGHTIACRHYGLPATLPYFIPAPIGIGTFGAVISIRAPIERKRVLFDVGAAGPLAGFCAAIPVLLWGISTSTLATARPSGEYFEFGEPLLFRWAEHWLFPATRHGADLTLSPSGFAAWFGLLVTALNLLPLAQLDGGHILYAAIGKLQRPIGYVLFAALLGLAVLWPGWLLWAVIVLVMGIAHPPTADASERLDPKRKLLALVCLAVFVLCFTPVPIRAVPAAAHSRPPKTYNL
ncbi:MAG: site-2 protease family protein [Thermoanaerobaculia bacterium]